MLLTFQPGERMKRKMEDLEKWRDVALAMTTADSSGHVISDSSDTSVNKSQPSVNIESLDSEPYTAATQPQQSLLPINTPPVLQYGPGSSGTHAISQPSVASDIDDIFSLDWNTSMDLAAIPTYETCLPSHHKKLARETFSPSHASFHGTRQRLGAATASSCDAENRGKTAFHLAAQRGQQNLMVHLLPAINDLNSRDSLGRTALHLAAEGGHSDIVVMLLKERRQSNRQKEQVIDINARDGKGRSALHLAIISNCYSTVVALVQNPDIDLELKDDAGLTPLHQSILANHEEIVKHLIANGADLNVKIG